MTFSKEDRRSQSANGLVPCLRTANVQRVLITDNLAYIPGVKIADHQRIRCGDLVVSMSNSLELVGKAALADARHDGMAFGAFLAVLRPITIEPSLLLALFHSDQFARSLRAIASQTTNIANLSSARISGLELSLPPAVEQRRIVAKIDRLSAKSSRACDHLDHIPRLVEKFKQAILDIETAKSCRTIPLQEFVDPRRGIPYGIVQTGTQATDGVPVVRCGDIKAYEVDAANLKLVDHKIEAQFGRTRLRGGEVLIAIRGSVGNTCVVPSSLRNCNISREVAMIPIREDHVPAFFAYYLTSTGARSYISSNIKGVAQQGINLADLRNAPVPEVDPHEQRSIVHRIETAFTRIDRLAIEATSARKLVDRLDQAVLSKAFRGELVPPDPADEPASTLLARIKAEYAKGPAPARRGRKPAAA